MNAGRVEEVSFSLHGARRIVNQLHPEPEGRYLVGFTIETSPLHSQTRSWCNRLWLLKNSLPRNARKLDRVRMPYKRFSPISDTFLVTPLGRFSDKSSFPTATPDYDNNPSTLDLARERCSPLYEGCV